MELQGKTAIIIGASQGFGKELARALIDEGTHVVIASKDRSRIEQAARDLKTEGMVADARQEGDLQKVAARTVARYGAIDLWVNSAGTFKIFPREDNIDMCRAHELMDINFFAVVLGTRTALKYMRDRGGIILNILSSAALDASRAVNAELYAASKWAVRGYVDAIRGENRGSPVQILSTYPGGMRTHLHDEALPKDFANFMEPEYVVEKVIANLKVDKPELDLIIKRPVIAALPCR